MSLVFNDFVLVVIKSFIVFINHVIVGILSV